MRKKTIPLRGDHGQLAGSVSVATPDAHPTDFVTTVAPEHGRSTAIRDEVNARVAAAQSHMSQTSTVPAVEALQPQERCDKCGRFIPKGSSGHAEGECALHHPGTRVAAALARAKHPTLDARTVEECALRLYADAEFGEFDKTVAHPDQVESMLGKLEIDLHYADIEDPAYRAYCLKRVEDLRAQYAADPSCVTEGDVHVWKHLSSVTKHEVDRKVRAKPLRVGVDMDGVVYDCHAVMNDYMRGQGYEEPEGHMTEYALAKHWNVDTQVILDEFQNAVRTGLMFRYGEPLEDGVGAIRHIYTDEGHEIDFITARDLPGLTPEAKAATVRWLRDEHIPFTRVHVTSDKESIDVDVLLDDAPSNVERAVGAGRESFILDRSFNRREGAGQARRSWPDILRELSQPEPEDVLFEMSPDLSEAAQERSVPLGTGSPGGRATTA